MRRYIPIEERVEHAEFKTLNLIDEGGMGSIVEVEEAQTGRPVALKVMHPEMMDSDEAIERFYLEAKVLARLEHPNIVPLHVLKVDREARPFYTMKKVQGQTLQGIISGLRKGDPNVVAEYPLDRLITVFHKVCDAMAFAHSRGVVHRDLKPANIMVGEFGEVLVMDWGLAKVVGESDRVATTDEVPDVPGIQDDLEAGSMTISAAAGALTREGAVMGTPQYMAPEQATGRISDIDERSDVFALGGILYALLTLHPPFFGRDVRDILSRVARAEVENPMAFMNVKAVKKVFPTTQDDFSLGHCPSGRIPHAPAAIAMKAMNVQPEKRYQKVSEMQADIDAWRNGYATTAEGASLMRQLGLLIYRNPVFSLAIGAVLLLGIWFGVKIHKSREAAERALEHRRELVPAYEGEARARIAQHKFDEALGWLDQCIAAMPTRASAFVLKGNIYQTQFRFKESIDAYDQALELRPGLKLVERSRKESEAMLRMRRSDVFASSQRGRKLVSFLESQERFAEASAVRKRLDGVREDIAASLHNWRVRMKRAGASGSITNRLRTANDRLVLNLEGLPITTLRFLQGIRLNVLNLRGQDPRLLAEVKGLPLTELRLSDMPLDSLEPLRGMSLRELHLDGTGIEDLAPLKGMPLRILNLNGTAVTNLSAIKKDSLQALHLRGCSRLDDLKLGTAGKLRRLDAAGTRVLTGELLARLKLEELDATSTRLSDLSALAHMPLRVLRAGNNGITRLDSLANMQLHTLVLDGNNEINSIAPLRGQPLEQLSLRATRVQDLRPIHGAPLKSLALSGPFVQDLSPLSGCPLEVLELRGLPVADLSALKGMPLKTIDLTGCVYLVDEAVMPLAECLQLEQIALPIPATQRKLNLNRIRLLPRLKRITKTFGVQGWEWRNVTDKSVTAFWEEYDKTWAKVYKDK